MIFFPFEQSDWVGCDVSCRFVDSYRILNHVVSDGASVPHALWQVFLLSQHDSVLLNAHVLAVG